MTLNGFLLKQLNKPAMNLQFWECQTSLWARYLTISQTKASVCNISSQFSVIRYHSQNKWPGRSCKYRKAYEYTNTKPLQCVYCNNVKTATRRDSSTSHFFKARLVSPMWSTMILNVGSES